MRALSLAGIAGTMACASGSVPASPSPTPLQTNTATASQHRTEEARPIVEPRLAMLVGLLPLRTLGIDSFRIRYPTYDGRGVIIAILDSGLDPSVAGFQTTTTGARKVLDLRDFSGEGRVALERVRPGSDGTAIIGGREVAGFQRLGALASEPYYGGLFHERTLGATPAADLDGNGSTDDVYPVVAARASGGWIVLTDTDGDGTLADERPVHDWSVAQEILTYQTPAGDDGPVTLAVNLTEDEGTPVLDLYVDNSGHGTHVSGLAAGHSMFGVKGFDGVAPGAQILALKISNNARGGISVSGSMAAAMEYAAAYAARSEMPLVVNLSFGVGNAIEGRAAIDSIVDAFVIRHPGVFFTVSAGNDGPGISTLGFPGSAQHAVSVCALFPGVYAAAPEPGVPPAHDVLGWFSARGGEVAKPDVCAPGVAYSTVPRWNVGKEISGGTSMAAPQVAGLGAVLQSAMMQSAGPVRGIDLKRALKAGGQGVSGTMILDEGAGVPDVTASLRWLRASHQTGIYDVQALPDGGNQSGATGAFRRNGLATPDDTLQRFVVTSVGGQPAARLLVETDVPWLHAPPVLEPGGEPITVPLTYDASAFSEPGLYVGTAWARPATDTLAGPAFGLTNTIIVPHRVEPGVPFAASGLLVPGATARYFVDVPAGSGGLAVRLHTRRAGQEATLHLFEPSGQPQRATSSVSVGPSARDGALTVTAEDVTPGVYEVVVVAPPLDEASYRIEVETPPVAVAGIGTGPSVTLANRTDRPVDVRVSGLVVGVQRSEQVRGKNGQGVHVVTPVPDDATTMVVDVALPVAVWHRLTDFGLTLLDEGGRVIGDGPLNYPTGRLTVALDTLDLGPEARIELLPAFAVAGDAHDWTADVRVTFLRSEPVALSLLEDHPANVRVPAAESLVLQFEATGASAAVAPGFQPVIEARAVVEGRAVSVRRAPLK